MGTDGVGDEDDEHTVELGYLDRHAGFDAWYADAHPRVLAAVSLATGDLDLAADATDEAFARALDRWTRVRAMASPVGWTVTVALNVARRRGRRRAVEQRLLRRRNEPLALPAPAGEVFHLLQTLPEQQRTIVLLRYVADLPQADIAAHLGVARSTVSTNLTNAHRTLRDLLDDGAPLNRGAGHD